MCFSLFVCGQLANHLTLQQLCQNFCLLCYSLYIFHVSVTERFQIKLQMKWSFWRSFWRSFRRMMVSDRRVTRSWRCRKTAKTWKLRSCSTVLFQSLRWGSTAGPTWSIFTTWTRTVSSSGCRWGSGRSRRTASSCPPAAPTTGELYRYASRSKAAFNERIWKIRMDLTVRKVFGSQ